MFNQVVLRRSNNMKEMLHILHHDRHVYLLLVQRTNIYIIHGIKSIIFYLATFAHMKPIDSNFAIFSSDNRNFFPDFKDQ